jgi:hypothetical protein
MCSKANGTVARSSGMPAESPNRSTEEISVTWQAQWPGEARISRRVKGIESVSYSYR